MQRLQSKFAESGRLCRLEGLKEVCYVMERVEQLACPFLNYRTSAVASI